MSQAAWITRFGPMRSASMPAGSGSSPPASATSAKTPPICGRGGAQIEQVQLAQVHPQPVAQRKDEVAQHKQAVVAADPPEHGLTL
jgi:hypothetical protein